MNLKKIPKTSLRMRTTLITTITMIGVCVVLFLVMIQNVTLWVMGPTNFYLNEGQEDYQTEYSDPISHNGEIVEYNEQLVYGLGMQLDYFYQTSLKILIVVLILGSIAVYIAVGSSLRPLDLLQNKIMNFDGSDMSKRIDYSSKCKEIENFINSFNELLERVEASFIREKSFSAGAAHELKTPLAVIKTNLDVLDLDEKPTENELIEVITVVENQTDRMIKLVNDLFAMCLLGGYEMEDVVEIDNLIIEIINDFKQPLLESKISIDIKQERCKINGNTVMIKHAIANIIENAIKYNHQDGNININSIIKNNNIEIYISDTGIGISKEATAHIFDAFYREDKSRSRKVGGAGLGLSISKNIIEQHGGKVRCYPNKDIGTTFIVSLPIV